jgi:hypothetical protein
MTIPKTLSLIAVLAVTITAPVSAQDGRLDHLGTHWRQHHFRDSFNQRDLRLGRISRFQGSTEEFRDRDASRIGGEDPSRHPTAY